MNILTKFGGLVAVAALLMAAGSLLVSPTPVHAAQDNACGAAGSAIFSSGDGTAAGGAAVTAVASGSTTTVYVLIDDPSATGQVIETSVSAGTVNGAASSAVLGTTTGVAGIAGCTTNAGLATNDTVGAANDDFAKYTFVAPTVASDTIVTVTVKVNGTSQGFGAVTVSATVTPDSLTLSAPTNGSIKAVPAGDAASHSQMTVTLKEGTTALVGQTVTLITTLGLFETDGAGACLLEANDALAAGAQACTATTIAGGVMVASLYGGSQSGTATVTAVKGSLSATQDVTLFGSAASGSGSAPTTMQQVAGTAVLTMTVVDASGNAVSSVIIGAPAVTTATVPVVMDNTFVGPATGATACSAGTNASGECTMKITTTATSSLGDHTLTATIPGVTAKPVIVVKIVGLTATITNDAPASVAGSSQTAVVATGVDANGDNVGAGVATTATIIEGNGGLLNDDTATNVGGTQTFTFVAPSSAGTTTILVTMGTASQLITVTIGAAAPTPGEGFGGVLSSGVNLTTYGGGTVAQLGTDSADSGATSVAVTIDGAFVVYVVGAPAFVNQAFSDQYPDGVPAGTVVLVLVS